MFTVSQDPEGKNSGCDPSPPDSDYLTALGSGNNRTQAAERNVCLRYPSDSAAWKEPWERARKKVGLLSEHPAGSSWRSLLTRGLAGFFSPSFHMIFWRHLEIPKHVQSSSARVLYWWVRWIYIRQGTEGLFSLPLGNGSCSKCRLLYWCCWLDSHRLVCTVLIKEGYMYGIFKVEQYLLQYTC